MGTKYISVPGYRYPIEAKFDPAMIDTSSGDPIVSTSDGYWVWGRGCTQPGGGIVPSWGFVRSGPGRSSMLRAMVGSDGRIARTLGAAPMQAFIDATVEMSMATAIYAILVDSSSGAPNSKLVITGNSQPGWTYPNIQAAQQYNAQMGQVMQLCLQAAQNAVAAIQQAAATNPNAKVYLGGAQSDLSVMQSWSKRVAAVTGGAYDVPSNWFNCAEQQQGNSITGSTYNFQCYPDVTWLELTYGIVSFAQQAVGLAHDALGVPRPPPPPPTPPCPKGQVRINGTCIRLLGMRPCPPGMKFDVATFLKNPAGGGCVPAVTVYKQQGITTGPKE